MRYDALKIKDEFRTTSQEQIGAIITCYFISLFPYFSVGILNVSFIIVNDLLVANIK